jgi:hypothetical protein
MTIDKNALYISHCELLQLVWQIQYLLYSSDRDDAQFFERVEALAEEMIRWRCELPESLRYRPTLPGPVYDL